jgi:hypothetical protein
VRWGGSNTSTILVVQNLDFYATTETGFPCPWHGKSRLSLNARSCHVSQIRLTRNQSVERHFVTEHFRLIFSQGNDIQNIRREFPGICNLQVSVSRALPTLLHGDKI